MKQLNCIRQNSFQMTWGKNRLEGFRLHFLVNAGSPWECVLHMELALSYHQKLHIFIALLAPWRRFSRMPSLCWPSPCGLPLQLVSDVSLLCPCFLGYIQYYPKIRGRSGSAVQFCLILIPLCYRCRNWNPEEERIPLMSLISKLGVKSRPSKPRTTELPKIPDYYRGIQTLKTFISRVCIFTFLKPQKNLLKLCGSRIRYYSGQCLVLE